MEKEELQKVYRHSLAHIMAKAVIEIYGKDVQYAIGPEVDDGCYYDFVLPTTVTEEDFPKIEEKMHEIIKRRENWTRKEISRAEALELFKDQKFKTELIVDLPDDEVISIYYTGDDYVDLCRGPHVENSQDLFNAALVQICVQKNVEFLQDRRADEQHGGVLDALRKRKRGDVIQRIVIVNGIAEDHFVGGKAREHCVLQHRDLLPDELRHGFAHRDQRKGLVVVIEEELLI